MINFTITKPIISPNEINRFANATIWLVIQAGTRRRQAPVGQIADSLAPYYSSKYIHFFLQIGQKSWDIPIKKSLMKKLKRDS